MGKYLVLRENVVLVNGAKRALIQDLENKKIYSIDELSKKYINKLLDGECVEELLKSMNKDRQAPFKKYLNLLKEKNLIFYSDNIVYRKDFEKKEIDKNKIKSVWLELRRACNLNCCHCYLDSNSESDENLDVLTLNEWISFIDQLKLYNPERITLIGGEPLMFSDINKLIEYIRMKFSKVELVLYSNLTLLNDNIIKCIIKNNVKVITSIYSNVSKIHDIVTRREGSFHITVSNIKKLKELNVYVKANITISKYNMDNIYDIGNFTHELTGIHGKFDIVRDVGISKKKIIPKGLTEELSRVKTKARFKGINRKDFEKNRSGNTCWQGKLNITCDGKISPCIMGNDFISDEYNIRTHSLTEIVNDYIIPRFWSISKDYIEECRDCEYRYVCNDCRPICAEKGNLYSKGRFCTYDPYQGIWEKL